MVTEIAFSPRAWEDYLDWNRLDPEMWGRINALIKVTCRDPFRGIGKPEPLKGNFKSYWSRRINQEHRLVYKVDARKLIVVYCRGHYTG